ADEFPHGPGGLTIAEYLRTLDRRFRIVGGRFFNHWPDRRPANVPGLHPLDFQPLCREEEVTERCHYHHPLQRFDRHAAPIVSAPGFHTAACSTRPLVEPPVAIVINHFPFREEAATRARFDALFRPDETGDYRNKLRDDRRVGQRGFPSAAAHRLSMLDPV